MAKRTELRTNVSRYRAILFSFVVIALTTLSFHGELDEFARTEVVETTSESIGIYVISRGINALVSVLQTSQVNVPFLASAQVGEMLDPVNDAVERLSSIVVWAVGSLFLQRILIEIAASPAFKWILCSLGLATATTLLLMEWERCRILCRQLLAVSNARMERCRDWLVRVFVLAAIFRFIVPLFISASFLVSQIFLNSEIAETTATLSQVKAQVSTIASSPTLEGQNIDEQKALEESRLKDLNESMASAAREAEQLDETISTLKDAVGWRRVLPESLGGVSTGDELESAYERRKKADREMKRIEDQIREREKNLDCIDRRIAGGTCDSLLQRVSKAGKAGMSHIKDTFEKINDMVTDVTMLLIAVAIKNILFPILFLVGAVKCALPVARHASRLLSGFEQDSKKLRGIMRQLKAPTKKLERHGPRG